ncbi:MAG: hypothetical protein ACLVJX_09265 [Merdibacter sp.]
MVQIVLFALRLIVTILHPCAAINRLPLIGWLNHWPVCCWGRSRRA